MLNNEAIRARENMNKIMSIMMQFDDLTRIDLLEGVDSKKRLYLKDAALLKQCR